MGYYSAFKIDDTSGLKIPKEKIDEFISKLKKINERIGFIDNIDDDSISGKEYKEYQKEKETLLKPIIVSISPSFNITNDYFTFENNYSDKKFLIYFNDKEISFMLDEGETFELKLSNNYYIGNGELYASSNHSRIQDMIEIFIKEFKCSAIIEDMGDEEYGFVYEDGCNRDLKVNIIYKEGVLI